MSEKRKFGRDLLVEALGTVIGGNLVFATLAVVGVISEVDWQQVGGVVLITILGAIGLFVVNYLEMRQQSLSHRLTQALAQRLRETENLSPEQKKAIEDATKTLTKFLGPLI